MLKIINKKEPNGSLAIAGAVALEGCGQLSFLAMIIKHKRDRVKIKNMSDY